MRRPAGPSRVRALSRWAGLAACAGLGLAAAEARGQTYEPNIPDFYQHQRWGANDDPSWEFKNGRFGGWCLQTAVVDGFFYWKAKDPAFQAILSDDITDRNKWIATANAAIKGLSPSTQSIERYLKGRGIGANAGVGKGLSVTQFIWEPFRLGYRGGQQRIDFRSSDPGLRFGRLPATTSFFDLYSKQINKGLEDTLVLRTENPGTVSNKLWWRGAPLINNGSFHAVAGVGSDAENRSILFADPDTNKGSAAADGGINPTLKVGGIRRDPAVDARKFQAGDPVPVPAPPAKGTDPSTLTNWYKTVSLAADGRTIQNVAANDPYQNVSIVQILTLAKNGAQLVMSGPGRDSRVAAHLPGAAGATGGSATPTLTVDLGTGSDAAVKDFWIFPNAPMDFHATPYFTRSGWDYAYLDPGCTDIFGNVREFGGVEITDVSGLALGPSDLAALSFSTQGVPTGFDVYLQNANDPSDYDVQVYGGPETFLPLQQAVPEPPSLVLFVAGLGAVLAGTQMARRRRPPSSRRAHRQEDRASPS
jgi:hypothetical protein